MGYPSGSSLSSDFPPNSYLNGYQDFVASRGRNDQQSNPIQESYSSGYPPAKYPSENENYQSGGYRGYSSPTPENSQYNIQTQQKHEIFATPQPLTDIRSTVAPQIQQYNYAPPTGYNYQQGLIQPGQNPAIQTQFSDEKEPELGILDQLSTLEAFFPGDGTGDSENSSFNEDSKTSKKGFFENLFSRFRGSTESSVIDVGTSESEESQKSEGFLSSIFGLQSENTQSPDTGSFVNTESTGNAFSSLFYQPETERPAIVLPTTYYLPKTRGSYIAVKVPAANTAPGFGSSIGPFDDLSNIAFQDVPKVPFKQHEIPKISGPTLESGYPYNSGYLDARNSGLAVPKINTDFPPSSFSLEQPLLPSTGSDPYSPRQQSGSQVENFSSSSATTSLKNEEAFDLPRAEYVYSSVNNDQTRNSPINSQSAIAQFDGQSSIGYSNPNENYDTENQSGEKIKLQNFGTENSDFESSSNFGENFGTVPEIVPEDYRGNEPIFSPQLSGDFIPVLSYGPPDNGNRQLNFNDGSKYNNGQNVGNDEFRDSLGDVLTQNFEDSSPALSEDLVLPVQITEPRQNFVPVYETSISALQSQTTLPNLNENNRFLPIKEAVNFYGEKSNFNQEESDNDRFVQNLSSLTSFGTLSDSLYSESPAPASSNVRGITVYPSTSHKVDDVLDVNVNKNDSISTTLEQLPVTKKAGRFVRKVTKRRNSLEGGNSQSSRRTPTEDADASSIIKSENHSIPEVRGSRQFDETNVITGYSKVQHPQHQILQAGK